MTEVDHSNHDLFRVHLTVGTEYVYTIYAEKASDAETIAEVHYRYGDATRGAIQGVEEVEGSHLEVTSQRIEKEN